MTTYPMSVNLGCGEHAAPGWINVDRRPFPGVQVVLPGGGGLPWADDQIDRVYAGHVLEHLDYGSELPAMLAEIHRVLKPNGHLMVVGPDLDRAYAEFPDEVENIWPGAIPLEGSEPGAAHRWPSTVERTAVALSSAGFDHIEVPIEAVDASWPVVSRIGWQLAFLCRPAVDAPSDPPRSPSNAAA